MRRISFALTLLFILFAQTLTAQSAEQLYAGGRRAFTDKLWPTAVSQFRRLLRDYPDDPRADSAAYMGAVASLESGDYETCLELLDGFSRRYPDSAWNRRAAFWEGSAHYALGNWNKAAASFKRQSRISLESAYQIRSLLYLGASLENTGDWSGAEEAYSRLLESGGDYETAARALFRQGQVRLASERPEEALRSFNRLALNYTGAAAAADVEYWLAESQREIGRGREALAGYRSFLESRYDSPFRSRALIEAAALASEFGQSEDAVAYLDLRDREFPSDSKEDSGRSARIRAAAYLRLGRLEDSREAYLAVLAEVGNGDDGQIAAFGVAQTWIGTGSDIRAVRYLEQAAKGPDQRIAADAAFLAGRLLLLDGQRRGASVLESFSDAYPNDPRSEEALKLAVRDRKENGEIEAAISGLGRLIRDYNDSPERDDYFFLRAELELERGDSTAALRDYGAIADDSKNAERVTEALSRIGFVYGRREEFVRAAEYYLQAADRIGGAGGGQAGRRAVYSAGVAYLNAGRSGDAAALFESLMIIDPSGPWGTEAAYHLGEAHYDSGEYEKARQAYRVAADNADGEWAFEAAYALGWTWFRQSNWKEAEQSFRHAATIAATEEQAARARFRIGLSLASTGRWDLALTEYQPAVDYGGGGWREEALYQYSWALMNLGRIEEAQEIAGILALENPASGLPADLPFRMGEDAVATGKYTSAILWYDRCIAEYPDSPTAVKASLRAAMAAELAGDETGAADRYREWIARRPKDPGAGAAARSWARIVRNLGNPETAEQALAYAESIDPGNGSVSYPMVISWTRVTGNPADAANRLERIAKDEGADPSDRSEALLLRAHRYRLDSRFGRAAQIYEVLIRDVPGRIGAEAQEGLAKTYAAQDKVDQAAEAYLAVPYLFPDETDIAARSLREAERLFREAGRDDEADKLLQQIAEAR